MANKRNISIIHKVWIATPSKINNKKYELVGIKANKPPSKEEAMEQRQKALAYIKSLGPNK